MNVIVWWPRMIGALCVLLCVAGCSPSALAPKLPAPTFTPASAPGVEQRADGLSSEEAATLGSLEQVGDYPLYTMYYYGAYREAGAARSLPQLASADPPHSGSGGPRPAWGCSLFAALGDPQERLYGRNFDWEYSPALLLFTHPAQGYASVSMVDIAYLGFGASRAKTLMDLPLAERGALLDAPWLPFDGLNAQGLAVGMAAVPPGNKRPDPDKESIGSLEVIREILDRAGNVDEAVAILSQYNITMAGGPPLHYLVADASGQARLVEFYQGEMVVFPNQTPWQQATNFLRAAAGASPAGQCWRYDTISQRLAAGQGQLTSQAALELLQDVSQDTTQWSVVYGMSDGQIQVAMGGDYERVHTFQLSPGRQ